VVVVPGIGGSVLEGPAGSGVGAGGGGYALTVGGLARTVFDPGRMDLDRWPELVPTGLVRELALLPPLVTLPGYGRLYQLLREGFDDVCVDVYRPPATVSADTDVLMVPYDFRRSVVEASQRLGEAVEHTLKRRGDLDHDASQRPVIVVAHSLGGLVARHWIAVRQGWRHCAALLTLGTPHRGAPKALDWLVNGAGAGPLRSRRVTEVIRGWPSVYELLPQYDAVWDSASEKAFELVELPGSVLSVRQDLTGYAERFATMAQRAPRVHDEIRTNQGQAGPCGPPGRRDRPRRLPHPPRPGGTPWHP
jgi:pimeloyl-ACP methyl ester carboxylesterase